VKCGVGNATFINLAGAILVFDSGNPLRFPRLESAGGTNGWPRPAVKQLFPASVASGSDQVLTA